MARFAHRINARRVKAKAFTLIEVLIALAILSIALGAVLAAMGQAINVTGELRDRTVALWVAQERANEHILQRAWPEPRTTDGNLTLNGREWKWVEKVSTTDVADMRRMDIEVSLPKSQHVLAKIAVFFVKP